VLGRPNSPQNPENHLPEILGFLHHQTHRSRVHQSRPENGVM
jgi:hypothetical protein